MASACAHPTSRRRIPQILSSTNWGSTWSWRHLINSRSDVKPKPTASSSFAFLAFRTVWFSLFLLRAPCHNSFSSDWFCDHFGFDLTSLNRNALKNPWPFLDLNRKVTLDNENNLAIFPVTPKRDNVTPESHTKVMRIMEVINNYRSSWSSS